MRAVRSALVVVVIGTLLVAGGSGAIAQTATRIDSVERLPDEQWRVTGVTTGCEGEASLVFTSDWRIADAQRTDRLPGGGVASGTDFSATTTVAVPPDWPALYVYLFCDQSGPGHEVMAAAMMRFEGWVPQTVHASAAPATSAPTSLRGSSPAPLPAPVAWSRTDILPGPAGTLAQGAAVAADGTMVIVGGRGPVEGPGVAWVTTDGATWSQAKMSGPKSARPLGAVALPGGGFLAFGPGGTLWRSADGTAWKAQKKPLKDAQLIAGTTLADGTLLLTGSTGFPVTPAIFASTDGAAWTRVDLPPVEGVDANVSRVAQHPDGTLLVASAGGPMARAGLWRSVDGTTWEAVAMPDTEPDAALAGIAAGPSGFVAVVNHIGAALGAGVLWTSPDGAAWEATGRVEAAVLAPPIALPDGVAVPQGGLLHVTTDGRRWTQASEPAFSGPFMVMGSRSAPDGRLLVYGWHDGFGGTTAWVGSPGE